MVIEIHKGNYLLHVKYLRFTYEGSSMEIEKASTFKVFDEKNRKFYGATFLKLRFEKFWKLFKRVCFTLIYPEKRIPKFYVLKNLES